MTSETSLKTLMSSSRDRIETALRELLPDHACASPRLADAMRYAATGGGKRIRPILVYAACELAGGKADDADVPAAAVELVHAYSLVHDDLPSMDDDDLRRGQPTCHRAYDEATAILAGDTLHTLAFELLAHRGNFSATQRVDMITTLCRAAGAEGMAAGQMQDMQGHGQQLTLAALEEMHYLKTGRLITAALLIGVSAADNGDRQLIDALREYGDAIGLAFQVQDDILDVTAATEQLGKPSGSDEKHGKSTFPGLIGLEASRARAEELCLRAINALSEYGERAGHLTALARYVIQRSY
jgi:farnesyl diphosphate synthase